jgi:nuclear pore complex protein Nup62
MDEIITRWASDLNKYQKQFQSQANLVARWDRLLVENTTKISSLYSKTYQAERDAAEVERQLSFVENAQGELEQWLTKYEQEVTEMSGRMGGDGAGSGVDLERERMYRLAEKVTSKLDEMNNDLGDVIGEINDVASKLTKVKQGEDPVSEKSTPLKASAIRLLTEMQLSQVVRVLNAHLQQLQTIDVSTSTLEAKVQAAKREARLSGVFNGHQGLGSDPAEDFYKSFMSRR